VEQRVADDQQRGEVSEAVRPNDGQAPDPGGEREERSTRQSIAKGGGSAFARHGNTLAASRDRV